MLHVFHATDGYLPTGLVKGSDGNFYGTTVSGGQPSGGGGGTFFRMDAAGNFTVLYAFVGGLACCDGAGPTAPPIQASDGNFYGTTGAGGLPRRRSSWRLWDGVPVQPGHAVLTILHSFNLPGWQWHFPEQSSRCKPGRLARTARPAKVPVGFTPAAALPSESTLSGNFSRVAVIPRSWSLCRV